MLDLGEHSQAVGAAEQQLALAQVAVEVVLGASGAPGHTVQLPIHLLHRVELTILIGSIPSTLL